MKGSTPDTNIQIETDSNFRALYNNDHFKDLIDISVVVETGDNKVKRDVIYYVDLNNSNLNSYKHYLIANSTELDFKPRWRYRPNYLSYDVYGTQAFAPLLLFINDVMSCTDFDLEKVKVPKISAIKEMILGLMKK